MELNVLNKIRRGISCKKRHAVLLPDAHEQTSARVSLSMSRRTFHRFPSRCSNPNSRSNPDANLTSIHTVNLMIKFVLTSAKWQRESEEHTHRHTPELCCSQLVVWLDDKALFNSVQVSFLQYFDQHWMFMWCCCRLSAAVSCDNRLLRETVCL